MTYRVGSLMLVGPEDFPVNAGFVDKPEEWRGPAVAEATIALPHRCDEWIIGGLEEARALRDDLNRAIAELERRLEKAG